MVQVRSVPMPLGLRNFKLTADLAAEEVVDLAMPGHRARLASGSIDVHRMARAFAQELTAVVFEVVKKVPTLESRP